MNRVPLRAVMTLAFIALEVFITWRAFRSKGDYRRMGQVFGWTVWTAVNVVAYLLFWIIYIVLTKGS